jgi:4-diphosphocytidyl-2-C-methyl-D-erythritol kinase
MSTRVRSYSKINLGLAIGPVRADGFHGLLTLYQTLALCDFVTVRAQRAGQARIELTTTHPFVPRDGRNTAWKMVEKCLARLGIAAEVQIHIEKNLPVQGGMGAGSANAAAALIGLERELGVALPDAERLALAAEVGSDVPLFVVGGAVLGTGRGELVEAMPDLPPTVCLVAVPGVGVSTPAAFRAWDKRQLVVGSCELLVEGHGQRAGARETGIQNEGSGVGKQVSGGVGLTSPPARDRVKELSHAYASAFGFPRESSGWYEPGTSGIVPGHDPAVAGQYPEKKQGGSGAGSDFDLGRGLMGSENDLAENTLLSPVRTGVENNFANEFLVNDFEEVVFPEYPSLREIKRLLMGIETEAPALYAALSGSGSALFGLYRSTADAEAAQRRIQAAGLEFGVKTFLTETLPRPEYWARMFAG